MYVYKNQTPNPKQAETREVQLLIGDPSYRVLVLRNDTEIGFLVLRNNTKTGFRY